MTGLTVTSFFCAVALLQAAMSEAAWLPRMDLLRRQTGLPPAIPLECNGICTPALTALQACDLAPSVSCLCPPSLQSGLFDCFTCAGQSGNTTDYSVPQTEIDEITTACDQAGAPLPVRTFPGQNPNRALTTSATAPIQVTAPTVGNSSPSGSATSATVSSSVGSLAPIQTAKPLSLPSAGPPSNTGASSNNASATIASTSSINATSAPAIVSGNSANRRTLPIWTAATGIVLVVIFIA